MLLQTYLSPPCLSFSKVSWNSNSPQLNILHHVGCCTRYKPSQSVTNANKIRKNKRTECFRKKRNLKSTKFSNAKRGEIYFPLVYAENVYYKGCSRCRERKIGECYSLTLSALTFSGFITAETLLFFNILWSQLARNEKF